MENPRIVVADDDPYVLDLVKMILEPEGFSVQSASNGQEALTEIAQQRPDIALLDVMMPVMDGVRCCRELRKNPETSKIPVVVMSAGANLSKTAKEIGANGFIAKPFSIDDLIAILQRQLGNGEQAA
ncbi:MAG: response regulator, partial [Chloroflexi bacterium]|nr:response regulator [Chloroflexota bacterium]